MVYWMHLGIEGSPSGRLANAERPYGVFTFDDSANRKIWIGGGIGITLLIARMKQLAKNPAAQGIGLFHSSTELALCQN
tara:strand:+ start:5017 stop:5253 length:237 start_codon:yes stop_codon:yes gene_type:complete